LSDIDSLIEKVKRLPQLTDQVGGDSKFYIERSQVITILEAAKKAVYRWCGKEIMYGTADGKWYHSPTSTSVGYFWCHDSTGTRRAPRPE